MAYRTDTLCGIFHNQALRYGDQVELLRAKFDKDGNPSSEWHSRTWKETRDEAIDIAKGLIVLGLNKGNQDRHLFRKQTEMDHRRSSHSGLRRYRRSSLSHINSGRIGIYDIGQRVQDCHRLHSGKGRNDPEGKSAGRSRGKNYNHVSHGKAPNRKVFILLKR